MARPLCRQLLASQPGHPDALHLLAMATRANDPREAEQLFRESLARAPQQPACASTSPTSCARPIGPPKPSRCCARPPKWRPQFVPGWYNLGHSAAPRGTAGGSGALREPDQRAFAGVCSGLGTARRDRAAARRPRRRDRRVPNRTAPRAGRRAAALLARSAIARGLPLRRSSAGVRGRARMRIRDAGALSGTAVRRISKQAIARQALTVLDAGVTRYPGQRVAAPSARGSALGNQYAGRSRCAPVGRGAQQSSRPDDVAHAGGAAEEARPHRRGRCGIG